MQGETNYHVSPNWHKLMQNQDSDYAHNLEYLKKYRELGCQLALEWLVLNNANLVHKVVGGYRNIYSHKLDYDDMFSVGMEGLLRAVEKFDFSFDNNFATYAMYWIKQSVMRAISDAGFTIKIPSYIFENLNKICKAEKIAPNKDATEICEQLGISQEKYEQISQVRRHMLRWASLNATITDEDETEIGDLLDTSSSGRVVNLSTHYDDDFEASLVREEMRLEVGELLGILSEREKFVINHRFGIADAKPMTLAEIGKIQGVSRERIRQIEAKAMSKLKHAMSLKGMA